MCSLKISWYVKMHRGVFTEQSAGLSSYRNNAFSDLFVLLMPTKSLPWALPSRVYFCKWVGLQLVTKIRGTLQSTGEQNPCSSFLFIEHSGRWPNWFHFSLSWFFFYEYIFLCLSCPSTLPLLLYLRIQKLCSYFFLAPNSANTVSWEHRQHCEFLLLPEPDLPRAVLLLWKAIWGCVFRVTLLRIFCFEWG